MTDISHSDDTSKVGIKPKNTKEENADVLSDNDMYKSLLDSIPDAIYVTDKSKKIIFYNKAMVSLLGPQNPGEKIEDRVKDYGFFLPDQNTPWPAEQLPLVRVRLTDKANGGIMFVRNKNRPEGLWIINYAYPLRRSNGETVGAVAVLKEIVQSSNLGLPPYGINVPPDPLTH